MIKKNKYTLIIMLFLLLGFIACETTVEPEEVEDTAAENFEDDKNHDDVDDYIWDESDEVAITLIDNSITISGNGATSNGNIITVTAAGTYNISGSLSNGQVIVDTEDDDIVRLILNGVQINCSTGAPIYIPNADKAMIVLSENSDNYLSDGTSYSSSGLDEDEPNAVIFSMVDLTIYGNGNLSIDGNYNDGIVSKDGLIISSGNINISSVDDGIRGKDYLIFYGGDIDIEAGGIGLKSDNSDDETKGYITVEDGVFNINSVGDAIKAEKDIEILYGTFDITSSGKGLNGVTSTSITTGSLTINATDDALHSNGILTINDGTFNLSSNGDGIHADYDLVINGGEINITNSYEGIESASGNITINGGEIHIVSIDDGLNLAAGSIDGHGGSTDEYYLYINDGYIVVNAGGDGVDANASIVMTSGDLIISGSSATSNSALDYDGIFAMNGGFLVASGSYSKMTEAPSSSSKQYCLLINFNSIKYTGTIIHIETQSGEEILTLSPTKSYQSVAFSSSKLEKDTTYNIYVDGSSSGILTDGIYRNGTYTSGNFYKSFTISNIITTINWEFKVGAKKYLVTH